MNLKKMTSECYLRLTDHIEARLNY